MLIDYQMLSPEAVESICREFVISHYSETDSDPQVALWTEQVKAELIQGRLVLSYSEVDQSVSLKTKDEIAVVDSANPV